MRCGEPGNSGALFCLDPNCTHAAKQSERILPDDLCWPLQTENYRGVGERAHRTEFVGHFQDHSRRINSITVQLPIIRFDEELLVYAPAGHFSLDDFFAADVTFNFQVAPATPHALTNVGHEWRVGEIAKVLLVGINLRNQPITDVDLEVLAIRGNHRDTEA